MSERPGLHIDKLMQNRIQFLIVPFKSKHNNIVKTPLYGDVHESDIYSGTIFTSTFIRWVNNRILIEVRKVETIYVEWCNPDLKHMKCLKRQLPTFLVSYAECLLEWHSANILLSADFPKAFSCIFKIYFDFLLTQQINLSVFKN